MKTADQVLLERWRARGDADAFREITARYANLVYAAACRVLKDATAAEDVAQECFEALALRTEAAPTYLGAWLHTVATNRALKHLASAQRRRAREERAAAITPEYTRTEWDDLYEHVDAAIAELPEQLRAALVGHYLEGQGKAALARALGVSRPTIHYRIDKGLEQVRLALRRRGVTASAGAFTAAMAAQASQAAPVGLVAALGKLAVAGAIPNAAALGKGIGASTLAGIALKKALAFAAAVVALSTGIGLAVVQRANEPNEVQLESFAHKDPASIITTDNVAEAVPTRAPILVARSPVPPAPLLNDILAWSPARPVRTLTPPEGPVITGRVLDLRGKPVRNASIGNVNPARYPSAQTDEEGRFRLRMEPEVLTKIFVRHERFSEQVVSGLHTGVEEVEIVLEDRGVVSGRVVDARTGGAISKFRVYAQSGISTTLVRPNIRDSVEVNDPRGQFVLDAVEMGDTTLVVEAEGHVRTLTPIHLERDKPVKDLVIALAAGAIAEGRVTDASGNPVKGALVHVSERRPSSWADAAVTDNEGKFTVANLRGDETNLYASETVQGQGGIDLTWNRALHLRGLSIVLAKPPSGSVEVRLTVNGVAAPRASVTAFLKDSNQSRRSETDLNGFATLSDLPPGHVEIIAGYPGQIGPARRVVQEVLVEAGVTAKASLDFSSATGELAGQVRLGNQPPDACFVQLEIGSGALRETQQALLKVGGLFNFESVISGEAVLRVGAEFNGQNRWRSIPLHIEEGGSQHLDIDFDIAGAVQGVVTGMSDLERGRVRVYRGALEAATLNAEIVESFGPAEASGVLAEDGSYAIEGIAPGRYTVVVTLLPDSGSGAQDEARFAASTIDITDGETSIAFIELGE